MHGLLGLAGLLGLIALAFGKEAAAKAAAAFLVLGGLGFAALIYAAWFELI